MACDLRSTMSALEASSLIRSELSLSPMTKRTAGYLALTLSAFSCERTRAEYSYSGCALLRAYSTSPPMYPVTPVLSCQ